MSASGAGAATTGGRRSPDRTSVPRRVGVGVLVAIAAVALFAGVGAADGHYGPDRFESNDEFDSAVLIEEGSHSDLTVRDGNSDFYAVELEAGDRLEASIDFTDADGDLDLIVYDPGQSQLDGSYSVSDGEDVMVEAAESGTYYVEVYGYAGASNEYDLEVTTEDGAAGDGASGLEPDRFEPNDNFAEAPLVDEGWYPDLTVRDGGVDLYRIDLEAGDRLVGAVDFTHADGNLDLTAYGPQGGTVDSSYSSTDGEYVDFEAPESGTYYVAVEAGTGVSNAYGLDVYIEEGTAPDDGSDLDPDQFESNDDPTEAPAISSGIYDGLTIRDGGDDFYAVDLEAGDRLEAAIEFAHGDLDLVVMDPGYDVVEYSASGTESEELATEAEQDGRHYVLVTGADNSASAEYGLDVNVEAGAGGDPGSPNDGSASDPGGDRFEPNDEFVAAVPIDEGTHSDLDVRDGNSDFYAIELTEGSRLEASIDFDHSDGDLDLAVYGPSQSELDDSYSVSDGEDVAAEAGESGTYYVEVYGYAGASNEYDLELSLEKPRYELSVVESDDALTEGETLEVTVEYTNVGELAGAGDIELVADGEPVDSATADLATEATGEATLEWEVDDADVETVSVRSGDDEEMIIDATEAESEEDTANESDDGDDSDGDDSDEESDDGMPLNPALAVVALVATALALSRRA